MKSLHPYELQRWHHASQTYRFSTVNYSRAMTRFGVVSTYCLEWRVVRTVPTSIIEMHKILTIQYSKTYIIMLM